MNLTFHTGNVVRDPDVRYTSDNKAIAKFTLAVYRSKDDTDFIPITAFGKTAELIEQYVSKGRKLAVSGNLKTGSYDDNGNKVYTIDVIAEQIEFLNSKGQSNG